MRGNGIVKGLVALAVVGAALVIGTKGLRSAPPPSESTAQRVGGEPLDETTRAALKLEADTPADTLNTVVTGQREQRDALRKLREENAALQKRNQSLMQMESTMRTNYKPSCGLSCRPSSPNKPPMLVRWIKPIWHSSKTRWWPNSKRKYRRRHHRLTR